MKNLEVLANEVIPVYVTSKGNKVVDARELHKHLGVKRRFADWIKDKVKEHQLTENEDFCSFHKNVKREKGGSQRKEFILRLHVAKKIALGTNNAKGDLIKDYFIKCEGLAKSLIANDQFNLNNYVKKEDQKTLVKAINSAKYNEAGNVLDIISHHQENCFIHFGVKPSELKKVLVNAGLKVKSKSAREIAREYRPELACSMAVHDDFVSKGLTLKQLTEVNLKEKLEATFKTVIELGITPVQLLGTN